MARSLNELELKWVELLLIPSFERKQILVEQLKNAIVISEIIEPVWFQCQDKSKVENRVTPSSNETSIYCDSV